MMDKSDISGVSPTEPAEMSEDEIDEALEESFPASDPPPWTLGLEPHNHAKEDDDAK